MTLTVLRRLVLAGNLAALALAGGSAWLAFGPHRAAPEARDWKARFPARPGAPDIENKGPGPWAEQYEPVLKWKQGDKPVPPPPVDDTPKPPPVPPFQTKYSLRTVIVGPDLLSSSALVVRAKDGKTLALWVRQSLPKDPEAPGDEEWSLDNVHLDANNMKAVFVRRNGERVTLQAGGQPARGDLAAPASGGAAAAGDGGLSPGGATVRPEIPRPVLVRSDAARGIYEWELPEGENDWWGSNLDEEVKKISSVRASEEEGGGIRLKAVPQSSRLAEFGVRAEDRVISVNDEKVNSIDHAVTVGKRQHEAGTSTFVVKIDRAGKIMNFTFRAKRAAKD